MKELYGTSVELELLQPVQENHTEVPPLEENGKHGKASAAIPRQVLLLLYAPFCSYSWLRRSFGDVTRVDLC